MISTVDVSSALPVTRLTALRMSIVEPGGLFRYVIPKAGWIMNRGGHAGRGRSSTGQYDGTSPAPCVTKGL
jgi:hypothetical protein